MTKENPQHSEESIIIHEKLSEILNALVNTPDDDLMAMAAIVDADPVEFEAFMKETNMGDDADFKAVLEAVKMHHLLKKGMQPG